MHLRHSANITAEEIIAPSVSVRPNFSDMKNLVNAPVKAAAAINKTAVYFLFISFEPLLLSSKNATISGGAMKNIS